MSGKFIGKEFEGNTLKVDFENILRSDYGDEIAKKLMDKKNLDANLKNVIIDKKLIKSVAIYNISDDVENEAKRLCKYSDEMKFRGYEVANMPSRNDIRNQAICAVYGFIDKLQIQSNCLLQFSSKEPVENLHTYMWSYVKPKLSEYVRENSDVELKNKGRKIKELLRKSNQEGNLTIDEHAKYITSNMKEKKYGKVTEKEIIDVMCYGSSVDSLDRPSSDEDDDKTLGDVIPDYKVSVELTCMKRAFVKEVQDAIDNLIDEYAERNLPKLRGKLTLEQLKNQYHLLLEIKKLEIDNEYESNENATAINNKKIQEIKKHISKSRNISTTAVDDAKRKLWGYLEDKLKSKYEAV